MHFQTLFHRKERPRKQFLLLIGPIVTQNKTNNSIKIINYLFKVGLKLLLQGKLPPTEFT